MKDKKFTYHKKKGSKLLMTLDCFRHSTKMKYRKIINLLDITSDNVPGFITKNEQKVMTSLVMQKIDANQINK